MKKIFMYFLIIISLFFTACTIKINDDIQMETISTDIEIAYPPPIMSTDIESGYPIDESDVSYPQGPEFSINVPVKGGTVTVTGTGPANVPIRLVNVSEVGLILGNTTIAPVGSFVFSLEEPLISGHMIGLQLGDISNTIFNEEDFLYSETYFERPFVGILFDLVVVE